MESSFYGCYVSVAQDNELCEFLLFSKIHLAAGRLLPSRQFFGWFFHSQGSFFFFACFFVRAETSPHRRFSLGRYLPGAESFLSPRNLDLWHHHPGGLPPPCGAIASSNGCSNLRAPPTRGTSLALGAGPYSSVISYQAKFPPICVDDPGQVLFPSR